jgi:hypothetical protein
VAHANACLNLYGRRLLVERVITDGRPVAHVAKELGISRQCAHRWVGRFESRGDRWSAGSVCTATPVSPPHPSRRGTGAASAVCYEHDHPGSLLHLDVKKIGRIPDGGGWKAHGRAMGGTGVQKRARIGFDYVHSLVDDHTRLAYSEILPDEHGALATLLPPWTPTRSPRRATPTSRLS